VPLTAEQREARRSGIGGSDAAAVVGRHPYVSPLALWLDKVHGREVVETDRMEAGNRLEPVIREWAADLLGLGVSIPPATIYHPLTKRMLVNLDGLLSDGRVLECKNVDSLVWRTAEESDFVDGVFRAHWWQVQHGMEAADLPGAVVGYLIGGNDMQLRPVERDRAIGKALREHIVRWWTRHVEGNEPPTQGTADDRMSLLERLHARESAGMLKTDAESVIALARDYDHWRAAEKQAKANKDIAKANLCSVIGAASGLDFGPKGKATWKADKHGTRTLLVTLRGDTEQDHE
jgi:putative phage-type endonuclease